MSEQHDDGGQASDKTLADEFAGKALANPHLLEDITCAQAALMLGIKRYVADMHCDMLMAKCAYNVADAMIAEKRRREGKD